MFTAVGASFAAVLQQGDLANTDPDINQLVGEDMTSFIARYNTDKGRACRDTGDALVKLGLAEKK